MEKTIERKIENVEMKIIEVEKVEPIFNVIKTEKEKYVVTIGNVVMCEKEFETATEAKKYINKKPWELIIRTCAYFTNFLNSKN